MSNERFPFFSISKNKTTTHEIDVRISFDLLVDLEVVITATRSMLIVHLLRRNSSPGRLERTISIACMLAIVPSRSTNTQFEEITPSTVRKTTIYETRRKLGQPTTHITDEEREEKYEVIVSSMYDESGLKILSPKSTSGDEYVYENFSMIERLLPCRFELDEEMYIACAILNESLYDTNADRKKVVS